ncbi:MAG: lamin tail domain-containing protein, partial [Clostridia bacterium]|nr:lamin tail domain-containing protein [Clostridia bacterium]
MNENTGSGLHGRRSASRATRLRRRRKRVNLLVLAAFAAVAALLVLVFPKEPLQRAAYTVGTDDGKPGDGARMVTQYEGLRISEVMPSNRSAVTDENGEYPDWVEIWNSADHEMNLQGIGLSDRSDSIRFLFPDMVLPADGRVLVFCSNSNQTNPGMPFHAKFKLSSVGETVYLYDPNAYLIDSCKYPILGTDESWALTADGFQTVTYFSPGYENTPEGHQTYRESIMVSGGALVISEVMADALTGLRDEDDELSDWVEIYNTTASPVSLENYALSDNESKPLKWRFPKGASIPAHGYYVVFCSGKDKVEAATGVPHTNFRISAEKETIILADSRGHVVDRVMIDNLPEDCSFGRNENGGMQVFQTATPGLPNNQQGFYQMDKNLRAINKSGVYISEVMASNDSIATYPGADYTDWIELYNSGSQSVDLSGYGLSDRLTRGRKWQFPKGTLIGPGEYKVVLCDGTSVTDSSGIIHAGIKINRTACETLVLTDPEGRILDKMILPVQRTNISYGRTTGMSGFFYY